MARCAVVGCKREGKPQVCPHDGQAHHHGRIHYGQNPESALTFHAGAWDLICDEHYAFVKAEREKWEEDIRQLRNMAAVIGPS